MSAQRSLLLQAAVLDALSGEGSNYCEGNHESKHFRPVSCNHNTSSAGKYHNFLPSGSTQRNVVRSNVAQRCVVQRTFQRCPTLATMPRWVERLDVDPRKVGRRKFHLDTLLIRPIDSLTIVYANLFGYLRFVAQRCNVALLRGLRTLPQRNVALCAGTVLTMLSLMAPQSSLKQKII